MKKKKSTNNDQQSTTLNTKDRVTRTPLQTGGELMCSGMVISSCSTNGTHRVTLVTNRVISHEWGQSREVFTTSATYPWSFVTQIFHSSQQSHGSVASLLAAILYQGNHVRNHKLWNIVSTERYILHMQVLLKCCYI